MTSPGPRKPSGSHRSAPTAVSPPADGRSICHGLSSRRRGSDSPVGESSSDGSLSSSGDGHNQRAERGKRRGSHSTSDSNASNPALYPPPPPKRAAIPRRQLKYTNGPAITADRPAAVVAAALGRKQAGGGDTCSQSRGRRRLCCWKTGLFWLRLQPSSI